jgi:hypothetical protein
MEFDCLVRQRSIYMRSLRPHSGRHQKLEELLKYGAPLVRGPTPNTTLLLAPEVGERRQRRAQRCDAPTTGAVWGHRSSPSRGP